MNFDQVFNVATAIVGVAAVSVIVSHPESAKVIKSLGDLFTGAIKAAKS